MDVSLASPLSWREEESEEKEKDEDSSSGPNQVYEMTDGPVEIDGETLEGSGRDLRRMTKAVPSWILLPARDDELGREVAVPDRCTCVPLYKKFTWGKKRMWASKAVYCAFNGSVPKGAHVVHMLFNEEGTAATETESPEEGKVCINPGHLACALTVALPSPKRDSFTALRERGLSREGARLMAKLSLSYTKRCDKKSRTRQLVEEMAEEETCRASPTAATMQET